MTGWGQRDNTTRAERAAWKERAKEQMAEQNGKADDDTDESPGEPRHARRKGLFG